MTNGITANITIWTKQESKPNGGPKIVATLHGTPMRGQQSISYDYAAGHYGSHRLAAEKLAEKFGLTLIYSEFDPDQPAGKLNGGGCYWEATA